MLTLETTDRNWTRRQWLTAGGLALGGLTLADLCRAGAARPHASSLLKGKSVIFLFQQGGPSQFETFDPKPEAPADLRTIGGTIQTSLPGIRFGANLPQLAQLAHKLTIVRSFYTNNAGHNIRPIVGPETLNANLGTLYARAAGATHPETAMPSNAVLFPQAVCDDVTKGQGRGDLTATGTFGAALAPFVPGGQGQLVQNLRLNLPESRFHERQVLREGLDRLAEQAEGSQLALFDKNQRQACEVLLSGSVADALDLSKEDPAVVKQYDTAPFVDESWKKSQRGQRGYYSGHAKAIGKSLLLARRLCEAGCGFVTVHTAYEGVWDVHADNNNLNVLDGMEAVGRPFDHAVAAFIADLEARGLSDKILLVCTGEMGRTPRINRNGGRDHWAKLAPLMMYGGGIGAGQVIGQSTRDGGEPLSDGFDSTVLISTILHALLDVGQMRLQPGLAALSKLAEPGVIPGLWS